MKYPKIVNKETIYYLVIDWSDKNKEYYYKTLNNAKRKAETLKEYAIRKESVFLRNENTEISASSPIKFKINGEITEFDERGRKINVA